MSEETVLSDAPLQRIPIGTRLSGIYQIDSLLGIGGMGEVYRGHAIETGDQVAIKTILPEFAQNESALALFRKEASALHTLYHEAIVRYFVFTIERDLGIPFLAMEYVEGESLSDVLRRGPLPYDEIAVLTRRLASGLQAAHEHGIVHRDISPDNIILPGGRAAKAKIIDFGIARSPLGGKTVIGGGFAGKFGYVSPEQLGLQGGDVTGQSDIYSLGLVLAQCASGKALDMGATHAEVIDRRRGVPDLGTPDPRLKPLLEKMLQPDPKARIASMADVGAWVPSAESTKMATKFAAKNAGRAASAGPQAGGGSKKLALAGVAAVVVAGLGTAGFVLGPSLLGGGGQTVGRDLNADDAKLPPGPELASTNVGRAPDTPAIVAAPPTAPAASSVAPPPPSAPPAATSTRPPPSQPQAVALPPSVPAAQPPVTVPQPIAASPPSSTSSPSAIPAPSNPVVASLPPSDPVTRPPPASGSPSSGLTMEEVAAYIRGYRGGDCFFVSPAAVSAREATIEGMGATAAPFVRLESDFKNSLGFEPKIVLNQVTQPQCPAVDFVARQSAQRRPRAPKLSLRQDILRSGQDLTGTADAGGEKELEILLVGDDGRVHNITSTARRTGDQLSFGVKLDGSATTSRPQLLLAIGSARPLASLKGGPFAADKLVRDVESESARTGSPVSVAVKYFKLGG